MHISKSGKGRHVVLTDEGASFFASLCSSRPRDALMLQKADGGEWKESNQVYGMRLACARANFSPINFHSLRHTFASLAIMDGVPIMIVAKNLGHVDTRMVERHYGHLAPDHVTKMIREKFKPFGITAESNVVPLSHKGRVS